MSLIKRFQIFFSIKMWRLGICLKKFIPIQKRIEVQNKTSGRCHMNLHRTRSLPGISNNNKLNSALISAVNVAPQHRHVQKPGNFILTNRQCKDSHFINGVYTDLCMWSRFSISACCVYTYKSGPCARVRSHVPACLIYEGKNMSTIFFNKF